MKKYLATGVLFLFNNEILSLLALLIMTVMFIAWLFEGVADHGNW